MGNVNRAVSSFPIFPGSAAGAAALKYHESPCELGGATWVLGFYSLKWGEHRLRKMGAPTKSQHLAISSLQNQDTNPHQKYEIV